MNVLGHMTHKWVLIVLFHALLFYVNRALSETKSIIGIGYGWAASGLLAVAIGNEMPLHYIGTGWMALGAILFEFGQAKKLFEFRAQAYFLAFFGASQSLVYIVQPPEHSWIPLAIGAAFAYAAAWRVMLDRKIEDIRYAVNREWNFFAWSACAFTAAFPLVLLIRQVPDEYIGSALWGLALVLLELGLERLPARLRVFAYPVAAVACLASIANAPNNKIVNRSRLPRRGSAASSRRPRRRWIMSARLAMTSAENATQSERTVARNILSGIGMVLGMIALWFVVPDEFVPFAWAALGLAVLELGNSLDVFPYRVEAQAVAVFAALSTTALTLPDGHHNRILAIALLIVVHIAFRFLSTGRSGLESKAPWLHEAASAILAASLIYQEVSGSLLTVAWGAEALVLLGIGFVFRERPLRLQGLGLFLVCVLKLFLYDMRNLETPYRILSFIALGLILLGVSWIYTRFREQLQKLL